MKPTQTVLSDILKTLAELHARVIMDGSMEEASQINMALAMNFIVENTSPAYFSEQEMDLLDCVADMLHQVQE